MRTAVGGEKCIVNAELSRVSVESKLKWDGAADSWGGGVAYISIVGRNKLLTYLSHTIQMVSGHKSGNL